MDKINIGDTVQVSKKGVFYLCGEYDDSVINAFFSVDKIENDIITIRHETGLKLKLPKICLKI